MVLLRVRRRPGTSDSHGMLCTVSEYPGESQRHDENQEQRRPRTGVPSPSGLPPMGWYPDPADARLERYWDGMQWTRNTRLPPAGPGAPTPASFVPQPQIVPRSTPDLRTGPERMPYRTQAGFSPSGRPATADGVRLAGWWSRVAALFVDYLLITVAQTLALSVFGQRIVTAMQAWEADVFAAVSSGNTDVPLTPADPRYGITVLWFVYSAALLVLQFVYATVLMHYKGATLGQLLMGLRVVHTGRGRDRFGLDWSTSIIRNAGWLLCQVLALVPRLSSIGGLLTVVNGAWPLFNRRRQALHDVLARTQVISTRP